MKKRIAMCAAITMMLAVSGVASATYVYADLPGRANHKASPGLTLGDWATAQVGDADDELGGFAITEVFQIHHLCQVSVLESDIDEIDDSLGPMKWADNCGDNEEYLLFRIDLAGELTINEFDGLTDIVGDTDIKWKVTGGRHPLMAGDMAGNSLVVFPLHARIGPCTGEPEVNDVEVIDGRYGLRSRQLYSYWRSR